MSSYKRIVTGIFSCLLLAGLVLALPAFAADSASIPLAINGKVMEFNAESDMKTIADDLARILPADALSISTNERIQYDYQASPTEAPVTILFDFNDKGQFIQAIIAANEKPQNPVARDLAAWLEKNVGKGKRVNEATVWTHGGLSFTLEDIADAGENSIYQMTIERQ